MRFGNFKITYLFFRKLLTNVINYDIINHVVEIVAQLAEHTPFKRRVEGSNPSYLTSRLISTVKTLSYFKRAFLFYTINDRQAINDVFTLFIAYFAFWSTFLPS